ncbi:beta-lactamase class C [Nitratireductor indicus]|nr:beta-lactamase class C [Nitratireductor indicus]
MKCLRLIPAVLGIAALFVTCAYAGAPNQAHRERLRAVVEDVVRPIMDEHDIPGVAVAVTVGGSPYFFNFGVASRDDGRGVSERTIFEIGSISKTFTATLASYAQEVGALSLSDPASDYLPGLRGSRFDGISLLELGTYTAGGLPLQFPDNVTAQGMTSYYRNWRPDFAPATHRRYSNPSIGLFGFLAAERLGKPFDELMEAKLFPMLGLPDTYIRVPTARMKDYAFGYSKEGKPIRVGPGVLDSEAYGVKTSSADLLRFVELNMTSAGLDEALRRAIKATHTGYYRVGAMTQGLGWELYDDPDDLKQVLAGNSAEIAYKPNKVEWFSPARHPREAGLINKTGSTNGFGAYAAFIPAKKIGVVILANRNYPIPARVTAAHRILIGAGALPF